MEEKEDNICLQFMESIEKKISEDEDGNFICISNYTFAIIDGINVKIYIRKPHNKSYEYIIESIWIKRSKNEEDEDEDEDDSLRFLEKNGFKTILDGRFLFLRISSNHISNLFSDMNKSKCLCCL